MDSPKNEFAFHNHFDDDTNIPPSLMAPSYESTFWLAKHRTEKNPHHDEAVFPSIGMVFMDKHTAPPGASSEGVG